MKKILLIILTFIGISINAQDGNAVIIDFEKASQNNLSFQNGINTFITTPKDDNDALVKGFKTAQTDQESLGGWTIVAVQDIKVDGQEYRAILYNYQEKNHIALHYKTDRNKYYFRIFNTTHYDQNE